MDINKADRTLTAGGVHSHGGQGSLNAFTAYGLAHFMVITGRTLKDSFTIILNNADGHYCTEYFSFRKSFITQQIHWNHVFNVKGWTV